MQNKIFSMAAISVAICLFAALFPLCEAVNEEGNPMGFCVEACQTALGDLNFASGSDGGHEVITEECDNDLHVWSIMYCSRAHCSNDELALGYHNLESWCRDNSNSSLPALHTVANLTSSQLRDASIVEYKQRPGLISEITIPSQDLFSIAKDTISSFWAVRSYHFRYSSIMFLFWAFLVGIGVLLRAFSQVSCTQCSGHKSKIPFQTATLSALASRVSSTLRAYLFLPATFQYHCHVAVGQCTIPPRSESLILFAFFVLNISLCCMSYPILDRSLYFDTRSLQWARYLADRAGYLSYANLCISWLFGIRNNLLIWMTGWNFATFNRFHRWIARISVLEAVIHSLGYTLSTLEEGDYLENFAYRYWNTGVAATLFMCLLLAASILWLRVRHYDLFLFLHISMAVAVLVNLFYHTQIFDGQYDGCLWACVGFWVLDRLARLMRVCYGIYKADSTVAVVWYSADEDMVRVDVSGILHGREIPPECHFYLYTPMNLFFWQSHPFSLVTWITSEHSRGIDLVDDDGDVSDSDRSRLLSSQPNSNGKKRSTRHEFLIRPYKGFTSRLRASAQRNGGSVRVRMLLEGPYDGGTQAGHCDEVLLIMGGSGIAAGISCIYKVLETRPSSLVRLVWAAKTSNIIQSVLNEELRVAMDCGRLTIDAYVTRQQNVSIGPPPTLYRKLKYHRPHVPSIIHEAAAACKGQLAVVVCGPAQMTDDARAAVVREVKNGQTHVELFVESFNW